MINWRDIRSTEQLNEFLGEYSKLEVHERIEITRDMCKLLADHAAMDPLLMERDANRGGSIKKTLQWGQAAYAVVVDFELERFRQIIGDLETTVSELG